MSSTKIKIINVLPDDDFEDILNIFKEASTEEVIFILPKKSDALNSEDHFAILGHEAERSGKTVSILTSNPRINNIAGQYNFVVLTPSDYQKSSPENFRQNIEEDNEWGENISAEEGEDIAPDYKPLVTAKINRTVADIVRPAEEDQVNIKITKKPEHPLNVGIKKEIRGKKIDQTALDEVRNIWQARSPDWTSRTQLKQNQKKNIFPALIGLFSFIFTKLNFIQLSKKGATFLAGAVLILLGIVIYVSTGSAVITLKPRGHSLDFTIRVSASDKFSSIDSELKRIPGQLFTIEKRLEEKFESGGEREVAQKARGKLTVYNEYSTSPQILIATTRFETQDKSNLLFRTLKTITIPGTRVQNGKIIPGTVEVEVIADKPGQSYNIGPAKFTIPAFKERGDEARYEKYFGLSKEAIKGGIMGRAKVVTEQDYLNAQNKVKEKIMTETGNELKAQAGGLKILILSPADIKEIDSTARVDEAVDYFNVSASAKLKTVGFKESDLHNLVTQYIDKTNNLISFPEKLEIDFENITFNGQEDKLEFTIVIKGLAYTKVNNEKILTDLMGKDEAQIKEYIKKMEGIASAKVILSPFWIRKVPNAKERVQLKINYE